MQRKRSNTAPQSTSNQQQIQMNPQELIRNLLMEKRNRLQFDYRKEFESINQKYKSRFDKLQQAMEMDKHRAKRRFDEEWETFYQLEMSFHRNFAQNQNQNVQTQHERVQGNHQTIGVSHHDDIQMKEEKEERREEQKEKENDDVSQSQSNSLTIKDLLPVQKVSTDPTKIKKTYQCPLYGCKETFSSQLALKLHLQTIHNQTGHHTDHRGDRDIKESSSRLVLKCPISGCNHDKEYKFIIHLKKHVRRHHGQELSELTIHSCRLCQNEFLSETEMKRHLSRGECIRNRNQRKSV